MRTSRARRLPRARRDGRSTTGRTAAKVGDGLPPPAREVNPDGDWLSECAPRFLDGGWIARRNALATWGNRRSLLCRRSGRLSSPDRLACSGSACTPRARPPNRGRNVPPPGLVETSWRGERVGRGVSWPRCRTSTCRRRTGEGEAQKLRFKAPSRKVPPAPKVLDADQRREWQALWSTAVAQSELAARGHAPWSFA
jgi:hypothetical protein